jgi:lipopolysaccharide transport system ATP-binding protein
LKLSNRHPVERLRIAGLRGLDRIKSSVDDEAPALLCVTHYKAGSHWIHVILMQCVKDRVVEPQADLRHFLEAPVREGMVYPKLYVTREQFESVELPPRWHRFVVIRDLRDTLVSGYFSLRVSHPREGEVMVDAARRFGDMLQEVDVETGLRATMEEWLPTAAANIQESWLEAGERLIRYEDLLDRDVEILEPLLIKQCELPVDPRLLRAAVKRNRFERLTGGRKRGEEDVTAHERKGIAGDWRNHFSEALKSDFKERWGDLLIATGYEQDLDW